MMRKFQCTFTVEETEKGLESDLVIQPEPDGIERERIGTMLGFIACQLTGDYEDVNA